MASDDRAPLTFACPSCGAEAALDVVLAHDESARFIAWVIERHAPLGALVVRYLRLFKPPRQRLRASRVRTVLEALVADMQRGAITRKGREWPVGAEAWRVGIEQVLDNHARGLVNLPLPDHAYLHEVLLRAADKLEAQAERQREDERRARAGGDGERSTDEVIAGMDSALQRMSRAVAAVAPPRPPGDYSQPSLHARRLREEIASRQATRQGGDA